MTGAVAGGSKARAADTPETLWPRVTGALLVAAAAATTLDQLAGVRFDLGWAWPVCCALAGAGLLASTREADGELFTGLIGGIDGDSRAHRWLLRGAVVALAPLAGVGPVAYAALALRQSLTGTPIPPRLEWHRSVGTGLLCLAAVLGAQRAGLFVGPEHVLWPILLAASGLPLFWSSVGLRRPSSERRVFDDAELTSYAGLVLTATAAIYVLDRGGLFEQAERTLVGTGAALLVLGLVVGPRWWRTSRLLRAERTRHARAEERTELARHLHDSVLQTLISVADLGDAIRRVSDGDAVFSQRLAGFVLDAFAASDPAAVVDPELEQLTARERDVLRLIARGYLYKEVAGSLGISAKTVETHVSAVLRKLQLSTRHQLSRWAAERRLVD